MLLSLGKPVLRAFVSLISSYIQQSSFNYVKSNWKNPSYNKDVKPREPTLLCVEYTISTPGLSRGPMQ